MFRLCAAWFGIVYLCGCRVGPEHCTPGQHVPEMWNHATSGQLDPCAPVDHAWWHALNDPVLDALVFQAAQQNLTLAQASARIAQARARRGV